MSEAQRQTKERNQQGNWTQAAATESDEHRWSSLTSVEAEVDRGRIHYLKIYLIRSAHYQLLAHFQHADHNTWPLRLECLAKPSTLSIL